eukprot:4866912-Amphidinium_carterae.1
MQTRPSPQKATSPFLEAELIQQQNEFKVTLAHLEALLLEKLANAEGDILDDTDLILNLEDAKKTSDEVKEKVVIAQDPRARPKSTYGTRSKALRSSMLNSMFHAWFGVKAFSRSLAKASKRIVIKKLRSRRVEEKRQSTKQKQATN